MMYRFLAIASALTTLGAAQRPSNMSICDYYTTALLMNNTGANQATLLTLVVNTAVIGNYTTPNVGITVPGILAAGEYNGTAVDLAPYFNGGLASTNSNGSSGVSVNFLDGGGAAPLMNNMAADDTSSKQYRLINHLYGYFGGLLGCSMMGADFPVYTGSNNMYEVHKFMDLSSAEVGYFISQVAASAASFGVATADLMVVGTALNSLFGYKCSPEAVVIASQPAALQAICIGENCPLSLDANCDAYGNTDALEPTTAVASLFPSSTAPVTGTATGTADAASIASAASTSAASSMAIASSTATATPSSVVTAGAQAIGIRVGAFEVAGLVVGFAALLL
ncbi:hypothetical protein BJ878DRAFT_543038 [Calycina marina]|uniref:Uncharacterized protein n=1 Tax=Calycina marina TaxID=1763456 RepID=A0A9P7Z1H5_9HELO|nr:hypothetical protein BJ878DRAFT_543038 [Calycina marina]